MAARFSEQPVEARRVATEALIEKLGTDVARWAEAGNLKQNWSLRAEMAAQMAPYGVRLLDIGCGAMDLERFLHPSITYLPADVVRRDERTLLCDLNAGELPAVDADVLSFLGVLEYVHNLPRLFSQLGERGKLVIASYNPTDLAKATQNRRAQGWFNDLTSAELCALAVEVGFQVAGVVTLEPQRLYEFRPV